MRLDGATICFDLDGTLIDTAPDLIGSLNAVLAECGHPPVPVSAARALVGGGARMLIERGFTAAGDTLSAERAPELVARFIDIYRDRIAHESQPFPGMEAALDELTAQGAILAVCTNKPTLLSNLLLETLGERHRFAAVIGADSAPKPKPDASHILFTIQQASGDPARALMIGDSRTDRDAARNANVPCILFPHGYTDVHVSELRPELVIDSFAELPAAVQMLLTPRLAPG